MSTVEKDKIIYLDIVTICEEQIVDEFTGDNSFSYIHGHGNLIQKLEDYLEGKDVGFLGEIEVPAVDAFGIYHDNLAIMVNNDSLSKDVEIAIGTQVETEGPDGVIHLYISELLENEVMLDGNHPLAGKNVSFQVKVLDIKDAHEDEIKHGRPHPAGHNIMMEDSSWMEKPTN
jgi:FKBP-type peptidyl-prolyl cis-trans isomerase SlyD